MADKTERVSDPDGSLNVPELVIFAALCACAGLFFVGMPQPPAIYDIGVGVLFVGFLLVMTLRDRRGRRE